MFLIKWVDKNNKSYLAETFIRNVILYVKYNFKNKQNHKVIKTFEDVTNKNYSLSSYNWSTINYINEFFSSFTLQVLNLKVKSTKI